MTEKMKVNLQIQTATDEKLEKIAELTFRTKGAVIDWLVSVKHAELTGPQTTTSTPPAATGS